MRLFIAAGRFLVVAASLGCGCSTVNLGENPEFLWWTDHETGDTSDWTGDGRGDRWTADGGSIEIVTSPTRSGRYAVRSTVTQPQDASYSAGIVTRNQGLPIEAYYSAWYLVPKSSTPTNSWTYFKFRSRSVASDPQTTIPAWNLGFVANAGGGMDVALDDGTGQEQAGLAVATVPVGRWFQTEVFLRATNDDSGRLTVWVDGTMLHDIAGQPIMPSSYVEWSVGGITDGISSASALYFDDAAISTARLGPSCPVFWRER